MKKLISLILALSMILGILATGVMFAADKTLPFTDVKEGAWYYSSVKYVYENGIMQGTGASLFEPELTLSRAMGAAVLHRVDGEPEFNNSLMILFEDVQYDTWYTDAVLWAYDNSIMVGRSNTVFAPNDDITRAEFAAIIARYAEYVDLTLPSKAKGNITDEADIPDFAKDAVKKLYEAEIIYGKNGNIFDPLAKITRAEVAAMIERFINNAEEKEPEITEPPVTDPEETVPHETDPEETDPPVTEPEETDPPVTEPEETDPPVIEPEEVIDVCLFNYEGGGAFSVSLHLSAFETSGNIKLHDYSKSGWSLSDYVEWLSENPDVAEMIKEEADIILLQEYKGGFPTVGEDADIAAIADHVDTISHGFYKGENVVGQLMEMLGEDKEYYSYSASVCGGVMKYDEYVGANGETLESQNAALLNIKKILKEKYNITHIFASDVAAFEPSLGLSSNGGTYFGYVYALPITGYCTALTVYCSIFGEKATEQNNGAFPEERMQGETAEEKAEYMLKFKKVIEEIIDIQNGEVPPAPTFDDEPEPPVEERPDDGVIDIYFFGNSITLQGYTADNFKKFATNRNIKVYDHSSNGASIESHLIWLKKWPDYVESIAETADIIVIQDFGAAIPEAYEGGSAMEELMDILGRDKEYYVHCGATVIRGDEVTTEEGNNFKSQNTELFNEKKYAEEEYGYKLIFTSDLAFFAPELGLGEIETFPDGIHPSFISGYSAALTLYCTIFGEIPSEMNNGILKDADIPGSTVEEKEAFMVELKTVVHELIDIQN